MMWRSGHALPDAEFGTETRRFGDKNRHHAVSAEGPCGLIVGERLNAGGFEAATGRCLRAEQLAGLQEVDVVLLAPVLLTAYSKKAPWRTSVVMGAGREGVWVALVHGGDVVIVRLQVCGETKRRVLDRLGAFFERYFGLG